MFKHLRKNAILLLFVAPLLAFFGLAPVPTTAAGSDPVQLVEQYLDQQLVSAETRSAISAEIQEAISQGANPAKVAEMVRIMIRERVQANDFEQLAETLKEAENLAKMQQEQLRDQDREQEQDQEHEDWNGDGERAAGSNREGEGAGGHND